MKKILVILLALIMVCSALACSTGEIKPPSEVTTKTDKPAKTEKADEGGNDATEPPEEETPAPAGEVTVEETVLVDEKDVKITLKSFEKGSFFGPSLKLLIENNSGKNLTFSVRDVTVNGYMNSALFYADVADGKKANDELTFSNTDLQACGITTIADIGLSFHIYDDDYDDYLDTERITVKTSAYEGFDYAYDDSGTVAFEAKGVKIIVKGLTDESIFGPGVMLLIINESKKDVTVTTRDVSVNGFMIDDLFYCDVLSGMRAMEAGTFLKSSLEDNGVEEIEEVEMTFHITEADGWDTIADSEPVTISFK